MTMIAQDAPGTARAATGKVLETMPAASAAARDYFAAKLACETDPADVWADLATGRTGFVVVDTRGDDAYARGHVPGAIRLPHAEIDERSIAALPAGAVAVTYCWGPGCNAGTKGALKLAALGVPVKEMIGGFEYWQREGHPIETGHGHGHGESAR